jgi:hypothetical protein
MPKTTTVWHGIDVGVGLIAIKRQPSFFNWLRLGFALIGLVGNLVMAEEKHAVR